MLVLGRLGETSEGRGVPVVFVSLRRITIAP